MPNPITDGTAAQHRCQDETVPEWKDAVRSATSVDFTKRGEPVVTLALEAAPPMSDSAGRTLAKMKELIQVAIQLNSALLSMHVRNVGMMDRTRRVCFCRNNPPLVSYESDHEQKCQIAFAALQAFEKLCYGRIVDPTGRGGS